MTKTGLDYLLSPQAVRSSCLKIFEAAMNGGTHFSINLEKLPDLADLTIRQIRENYPDMNVPFHSRMRHLTVGGVDRVQNFISFQGQLDHKEKARKLIDLMVVSVLLDAGAGKEWSYFEESTDQTWARSEGLAVASFHMFEQGLFSMEYRAEVNSEALIRLPEDSLGHGFQVSQKNPITGLKGRTQLLNNLGKTLQSKAKFFPGERPGGLVDYIVEQFGSSISAPDLLHVVLLAFGDIWPGRHTFDQESIGDAWPHSALAAESQPAHRFVVFHKLSQWLTYSLMEPLNEAGIEITNIDDMTGLAEYRNGGLFLDGGVIQLRNPELVEKGHKLDSELIIEWRALTVTLLDSIAQIIRQKLNENSESMPLVKILEGGTWWTGRRLANELREGGVPPLKLISDATIF